MSWQDKTRGGYPVRITARDPGSAYPIIGEVTIGHRTVIFRWTETGKHHQYGGESEYDLVPVEQGRGSLPIISDPPTYDLPLPLRSQGICRVPAKPTEDPGGDWEPTDEEFQYAQDLCRVPKGTHDPVEFRKFVDKAQAGEVSFTCSFVWEGPEPIRAKVGDRIQHPNGCWLEITESGFKIEVALNSIEFTG